MTKHDHVNLIMARSIDFQLQLLPFIAEIYTFYANTNNLILFLKNHTYIFYKTKNSNLEIANQFKNFKIPEYNPESGFTKFTFNLEDYESCAMEINMVSVASPKLQTKIINRINYHFNQTTQLVFPR